MESNLSQLRNLIGRCSSVEFGGRSWRVCPLTFNDLCDLEDKFGDVASIDLSRASTQRFLLWLVLRSADGPLERFDSEFAVGELLALDDPKKTAEFVSEVFRLCGLIGGADIPNDSEPAEKKAKESQSRIRTRTPRSTEKSAV
jgi:hypothetical protein